MTSMNNPSCLIRPVQALSGKSNSSECLEIKTPRICFETIRWSIMNLLHDSFDTFSNPWRQPLGQNHGGTWKVSNQAYNFWVCFDTWTSYMMGFIEAQVSSRLAKIDLVTIFDCDYRWYCTIDYVIVNYIGIHHLFYHIQWFFSH